ncbi:tetratricopeptide repeat protein [Brevundimonas sp. FT23042]|uniref:tetratricopeptide repeat protein n=1 Tax=Brevundimonas sp. FT23042 TaxID=3393749 RepID=UPI003B5891A0
MRSSSLRVLLTGCALLAFAAPAAAQDLPVVAPATPVPAAEDVADPAPAEAPAAEAEPAAPPIPEVWAPVPVDEQGQSAYGLYLSGRIASFRGDGVEAARLLAESQTLTPEQPLLWRETFLTSLFNGDLETVVRLTPTMESVPELAEAGRLVSAVLSVERGQARQGYASLSGQPLGQPFSVIGQFIAPSLAAAAGDWETALRPVENAPQDPAGLILRLQRAQLLEARRRHDEADAEYRALIALPNGARLFNVNYGQFLERRGKREEAFAQYRASLTGPSPHPEALDGLERLAERRRPPSAPTPVDSLAEALDFSSIMASERQDHKLAAIVLRLAEALKPSDMTALRLGLTLAADEQAEPARRAFDRVSRSNAVIYAGAQYNLGLSYQEDDPEAALAAFARATEASPDQTRITLAYAGQLLGMGRNDEALAVLNRPEVNTADQTADVRFLRGAALEAMGRIDEAEGELWAALQAYPDNPMLLNHLGYLWVDSGRRVEQGAEMIARAHAADPENGNIQDSLGWAQYRQGQYETAVSTLEDAVAKEPANAEINDHLGDAYWQVGRRREAEWQWNRVLTLDPDADQRAEIEQKLATGLPEPEVVGGSQP